MCVCVCVCVCLTHDRDMVTKCKHNRCLSYCLNREACDRQISKKKTKSKKSKKLPSADVSNLYYFICVWYNVIALELVALPLKLRSFMWILLTAVK